MKNLIINIFNFFFGKKELNELKESVDQKENIDFLDFTKELNDCFDAEIPWGSDSVVNFFICPLPVTITDSIDGILSYGELKNVSLIEGETYYEKIFLNRKTIFPILLREKIAKKEYWLEWIEKERKELAVLLETESVDLIKAIFKKIRKYPEMHYTPQGKSIREMIPGYDDTFEYTAEIEIKKFFKEKIEIGYVFWELGQIKHIELSFPYLQKQIEFCEKWSV